MNLKSKVAGLAMMFVVSSSFATTYQLSTHILDITKGGPAPNGGIELYKFNEKTEDWVQVAKTVTDGNGRVKGLLPLQDGKDNKGIYKLKFQVKQYLEQLYTKSFYPFIEVPFELKDNAHYHVPITLSPYGYSTYRGS